ncbi:MAG: HD domain-containing protein [Chloroflexia bacterium]
MELIERARSLYQGKDATHDFDHVLRVLALVRRIGPPEGANMRILEVATLLHDIARDEEARTGVDHALVGAERARQIVRDWGYSEEEAEAVARAIAGHRFRNDREPETIEAKVLYDADKLDALGAIGVGRAFAYAGYTGQRLWTPVPPDAIATRPIDPSRHSPVIEFAVKLSRLVDTMYTATGRALAHERHAFMAAFFEQLEAEVRGER